MVAIVGRPNVGKSSLLNTLAGRRISIVDATPGVTRDRVSTPIELDSGFIELVDTGGMGIEDVDDLTDDVEDQIASGVSQAALILFMVDAREGVSPLDSHVARLLRKQEKPVILLANKVDMMNTTGEIGELHKLGFGAPMLISATHSRGIGDMLDEIARRLGDNVGENAPPEMMKLAIVGKRNAGKSTFINSLVGQERVIVSDVPGTTRDSVDVLCEVDGQELRLEAYASGDELFFVFGDRTSGRETYPAGRFLYAGLPAEGEQTMLDFNRAYNPPCAFNDFATCPVASPQNRLPIRIEAGEKFDPVVHSTPGSSH